jgi:hypothetical protein
MIGHDDPAEQYVREPFANGFFVKVRSFKCVAHGLKAGGALRPIFNAERRHAHH